MSTRRADLYPPLGVKGGPCKVVDRILSNVQNVRDQEALIRDVESNRDLTNAQAAIIYPKPNKERGAPPFTPLHITSHAQYRMDLRGITVPEVQKSVERFRDVAMEARAKGNTRVMEQFRANPKFDDPKGHLSVVVAPQEDHLNVVTVYPYPFTPNPPASPDGCVGTRRAGYRAPAGELSGYRTYPSEKPTKGIYRSLGDTVEHPPGESPKSDRERARPQSTDTKENLEQHTPGNWAFNAPGPSSKEDGQKVPVRTVGQTGEEYGHPFKTNITPRRTEANAEFPPYSERQKKQQGEAKTYAKKYYLTHRGKIKSRAKIDYLHKKHSPSFKREKKYRNSEKFGWRFTRLPAGGYRSNADRARDNREKKAQETLVPFFHPNYGVGYVLDVVDQDVVIRQTDSLGGPILGEGTVPIFTFLRGASFDSELDIDAFFALADKDFGYSEGGDRTADFYRETFRPGDNLDPGDGVRDLGEPSPYSPTLPYPDTDRNNRKPSEKLDVGQVDNNPGSAKVIPSGHDFANKEAMAVRVAAKMADILNGCDPGIRTRAKSIKPTPFKSDAAKRAYQFKVPSSDGGAYTVKVQATAPEGVEKLSDMDMKVSCTCGFWQFQGPEHHAKDDGYLLGKPRGTAMPPGVRDPRGKNRVCKHVMAVLNHINKPGFKGR